MRDWKPEQMIFVCMLFLEIYANISYTKYLQNSSNRYNLGEFQGLTYIPHPNDCGSYLMLPTIQRSFHFLESISFYNNNDQNKEKPPIIFTKIIAELFGGLGGLIVGDLIVIYSVPGEALEGCKLVEFDGVGLMLIGAGSLASSSAVYLIGNIGNETGSFGAILAGGITGYIVGGIFADLGPIFTAPLGSIIGFNITRKYKTRPNTKTGLINIKTAILALTFLVYVGDSLLMVMKRRAYFL